jgi:hypothetical protein
MMTEQLESELRQAFAARSCELSPGTGERLRRLDYQPRTRSLRPPVAFGAVTAAGVAGVAVWVAGLGAGTTEAFAGWTPSPTPAAKGQITTAEAACRQRLASMPSRATTKIQNLGGSLGLQPALTDSRGPFTFVIFAGPHSSASCITGPSFTSLAATASSGPTDVPAGKVMLSSSHMTTRDGRQFSFAEGRTASDVTGTTLLLDDGTRVQASTANGWFVAWWPGVHDVTSAQVATPGATTTQTFHSGPARACPPPAAAAGPVSCTSASGAISGTGPRSGVSSGSVSMSDSTGTGP